MSPLSPSPSPTPGPAAPAPVPGALFVLEFPWTLFVGMEVRFVAPCDIPKGRCALVPVAEVPA